MNSRKNTRVRRPPVIGGTSGHPIRQIHTINGVTTTENLHWDGNTLLFTDNGQSVDDIKVGAEADYELISRAPSKFIVYDRDWVGSLVSAHNIGGLQNWGPPSPFGQLCGASSASMAKYTGIALSQPVMMEADAGAYTDGYTVFRGSASYNPALSSYSSSGSGPVVQSILRNTKDDDGGDPSDTSGDYSTGNDVNGGSNSDNDPGYTDDGSGDSSGTDNSGSGDTGAMAPPGLQILWAIMQAVLGVAVLESVPPSAMVIMLLGRSPHYRIKPICTIPLSQHLILTMRWRLLLEAHILLPLSLLTDGLS